MAKEARQLRITYRKPVTTQHGTVMIPQGDSIVIDRPRNAHSATRTDGRLIAEAVMRMAPGTDMHALAISGRIRVEELHDNEGRTIADPLVGWEDRAEAAYRSELRRLDGGFLGRVAPTRFGELADIRKQARREGKHDAQRARRERGDDSGFTLGKSRARLYAWITRGRDTRRLMGELLPGQRIDALNEHVHGVFRRRQDGDGDAANIVHGVGAKLTEAIRGAQKGLEGILLTMAQARIPELKAAIETAFTVEKWSSADDVGSKIALSVYEGGYDIATEDSEEQKKHGTARKTFRRYRRALMYPAVGVTESELDRRQDRKDRVASRYMELILGDQHAETKSLAYQRYRHDLATTVVVDMERPRTEFELHTRGLEEEVVDHLAPIVHLIPDRIMTIIERFRHEEELPEDYKAALVELKRIEVNEPTMNFVNAVLKLAFGTLSADGQTVVTKGFEDDTRLSEGTRLLWKQARDYSVEMLGLYNHANQVVRPQPTAAAA